MIETKTKDKKKDKKKTKKRKKVQNSRDFEDSSDLRRPRVTFGEQLRRSRPDREEQVYGAFRTFHAVVTAV